MRKYYYSILKGFKDEVYLIYLLFSLVIAISRFYKQVFKEKNEKLKINDTNITYKFDLNRFRV